MVHHSWLPPRLLAFGEKTPLLRRGILKQGLFVEQPLFLQVIISFKLYRVGNYADFFTVLSDFCNLIINCIHCENFTAQEELIVGFQRVGR